MLALKPKNHFVQLIKWFKDKWWKEAIYFAFIKANFLKSKSGSSVTYQIGLLPTKGALTYSGFILVEGQEYCRMSSSTQTSHGLLLSYAIL